MIKILAFLLLTYIAAIPAEAKFDDFFQKLYREELILSRSQNTRRTILKGDIIFFHYHHGKLVPFDKSKTNPSNPTILLVHGYISKNEPPKVNKLARVFAEIGHYNIIVVDWTEHAAKNYLHASLMIESIGEYIAEFLVDLIEKGFLKPGNVHLIGHSLGAHVAGIVGQTVWSLSGHKVDRITGLDPAAPLFETISPKFKKLMLNKNDATFVMVIHTNCQMYGVCQSHGHADVFVNFGGPIQPGCSEKDLMKKASCSHQSAHVFYGRSLLTPKGYEGFNCVRDSKLQMKCDWKDSIVLGESVSKKARGNYYFFSREEL